jgi:hypothetical protein
MTIISDLSFDPDIQVSVWSLELILQLQAEFYRAGGTDITVGYDGGGGGVWNRS